MSDNINELLDVLKMAKSDGDIDLSLTLWKKDNKEDVPNVRINSIQKALSVFSDWIDLRDLDCGVIVCFVSYKGMNNDMFRDEQRSILVSHNKRDINCFFIDCINIIADRAEGAYLGVFEFNSYEDAFRYCSDLKENC